MELKLLTYNIQAAIGTNSFRDYVTGLHRQVMHTPRKNKTLGDIGRYISDYDVVCLQEIDLGGRRANFRNQVDALQELAGLDHVSTQENRVIRNLSRHGNAILSNRPQHTVTDLKLPGKRMGRGAIITSIGDDKRAYIVNVHLSLGLRDQIEQVQYIAAQVPDDHPVVICGDFNCGAMSGPIKRLCEVMDLKLLTEPVHKTFPSWNPRRDFDHILVSKSVRAEATDVGNVTHSDHRPVKTTLSF